MPLFTEPTMSPHGLAPGDDERPKVVRTCKTLWHNRWFRVVSSAVEHCLHTAGATGSIPVPPTKINRSHRAILINSHASWLFVLGVEAEPRRKSPMQVSNRSAEGGV